MKARLVPLYFDPGRNGDFDKQLGNLGNLLALQAELLAPVPLGAALPEEADAVVFPQLLGAAYRRVEDFKTLDRPILVVTSEFGTLSSWDWEIISYLSPFGVKMIAPYNLEQTKKVCDALCVKRELRQAQFLVYQDLPGEGGFQDAIFKRFYWWEDECTQRMFDKFGVRVIKKSFCELGQRAKEIPNEAADEVCRSRRLAAEGLTNGALRSAVKLYLAVKYDLQQDNTICGVGINCLNESHCSDTTPCLAWSMLYEERQLIWGCEGDTMSMLTEHLLHRSLGTAMMMTNLYPFLLGDAALKHEKIDGYPEILAAPENHVLVAHCGYMGVIPKAFSSQWTLRPRVLEIVDENALAVDARLPTGPITLAKVHPTMNRITVVEGNLKGYVQYPGSDCRNGGVIEVRDGHALMNSLASHHYILLTGHCLKDIRLIAKIFELEVEEID